MRSEALVRGISAADDGSDDAGAAARAEGWTPKAKGYSVRKSPGAEESQCGQEAADVCFTGIGKVLRQSDRNKVRKYFFSFTFPFHFVPLKCESPSDFFFFLQKVKGYW